MGAKNSRITTNKFVKLRYTPSVFRWTPSCVGRRLQKR